MALSRHEAWHKAARLMAQCMGFEAKQKMRLFKNDHSFNEGSNTHEITFKLYITHPVETSNHKPLVKEGQSSSISDKPLELPLLKELNALANKKAEQGKKLKPGEVEEVE